MLVVIRGGGSADDLSCFNDELLVREVAASRIPTLVGIGHEVDETLVEFAADVRAATPSNAAQLVVPDKREVSAKVSNAMRRLGTAVTNHITNTEVQVQDTLAAMVQHLDDQWRIKQEWLDRITALIEAYSPLAVLERGYAVVRGKVVVGQSIIIETSKKQITAEVTDVKNQ